VQSSGLGAIVAPIRGLKTISRRDFLKLSGAGLTGAALLGVAGCGEGTTRGGGGTGGGDTFIFGRGADSVSLDAINASDGESLRVTCQVFDTLLDFAPESFELVPALATGVPKPEDGGLSYTLELRDGVKFHDGAPFNADAVIFNFDRWQYTDNPYHKGGGANSAQFGYFSFQFGGFDDDAVIEKVEAVDEYTVRFTLREPLGPFVKNLAMSPFAIASPEAVKKDVEGFWQKPVGSGPFKFVSWETGSQITLEKNPTWWGSELPESQGGGAPTISEVVIKAIPDNTSRVAALTRRQLTAADGLVPDDIPTVRFLGLLDLEFRPPNTIGFLAMNVQKEPFDSRKVRQAINMAIDMERIVDAFLGDTGEVATNYMPPLLPFFNESVERYPYDPDKARQMLQDAGLENLETELWYMPIPRPYMPDAKGIAQAMQQDLRKVGVNVKLVTYDWATYLTKTGRGEHPMAILGWTGDNGDPDNFLNTNLNSAAATEESAYNVAYYKNPELDELLKRGQTTIDEDKRRDAYYEAQEILHRDAPWVPIAYVKPPVGFQDTVQDYPASPTGGEAFNTISLGSR
jgi:peptide/nickel transport system substrate-binding protein